MKLLHKLRPYKTIIIIGIIASALLLLLIFIPWMIRVTPRFSPENYYLILSGFIAGLITLFALVLQFAHEHEKTRKENRINARGIFEVNYCIVGDLDNRLESYRIKTKEYKDDQEPWHFILKLHNEKNIFDCHVRFNGAGDDTEAALIGLVVPGQRIVVSNTVDHNKNIDIRIIYRTIMEEVIVHEFISKIENTEPSYAAPQKESMFFTPYDGLITDENREEILSTRPFVDILTSQSRLFQFSFFCI